MEELIKQALDKYFADFKEYHLLILIGFTVIIGLIQTVHAILVSGKIEKFKNELKKSEIKFSRYNQLQIESLRKIYHYLVDFQLANKQIIDAEPQSIDHNKFAERLKNWIKCYIQCANEFAKEKILLTEGIKQLYLKVLKDFEEVKEILMKERESLELHEMEYHGDKNLMYEFEQNELDVISDKIQSIKRKEPIKNSDQHIRELREEIEIVFKAMSK